MTTIESRPSRRPASDAAVIVPCYNYGRFLKACARSVLDNTALNVRVIVVDDGSTDDTAAVCAELTTADSRISVVRHQPNRGHIATFNHGLALADAEFVHLISADDELAPFALDRAVAIMRRHADVGMVYGRAARMFASQRPAIRAPRRAVYSLVSGNAWIEARFGDARNPIFSPEVTLRGSVAVAAGPYDPRLPDLGDLEMWLRTAARSHVAIVENAHQGVYRIHGRNMNLSSARTDDMVTRMRQRLAAFELFLEKDRRLLPNADDLRRLVRLRIARHALEAARLDFDPAAAAADGLAQAMAFASSIAPDADRTPEWQRAERLAGRHGRWHWAVHERARARVGRWWTWHRDQRDLGHRAIRRLYHGSVNTPGRNHLSTMRAALLPVLGPGHILPALMGHH
jgi:hypothetical protein